MTDEASQVIPNRGTTVNDGIGRKGRVLVVGIGGTLRANSSSLAALSRSVRAAAEAGARTALVDLGTARLPFYEPDRPLSEYGANVQRLIDLMRAADALIVSTAAYQGTVAGVTKNALDFAEFLASDDRPYLDAKPVGLIATAAGAHAAPNAIAALVHSAHALRAIVAPFTVPIQHAWKLTTADGTIADPVAARRLDDLGRMVVGLAHRLRGPEPAPDPVVLLGRARALDGGTPQGADRSLVATADGLFVEGGWSPHG